MSRSREEAIKLGIRVYDVIPSQKRRASWKKYWKKGRYGISIHLHQYEDGGYEKASLLSTIEGNCFAAQMLMPEQILRECGILLVKEGSNYFTDGIYQGIVKNKCCKKAYLRGMFLASGTVIDPAKGYDLEFVVNTSDLAKDLKKLISSFVDLDCRIQERGKKYVVYMKKADYVQDTLALMGADSKYLEIQNIRILKSMKNKASHALNCDMANNDRMLEAVEKQLPGFPIVLHGSSSVPQEEVDTINQYGGCLKAAVGIPEDQLRKAAKSAVCKINIDSDSRLAMTAAVRQTLAAKPAEFDPRKYLGPARDRMKALYMHKIVNVLGSNDKLLVD